MFGGDIIAEKKFEELLKKYQIKTVVETGIYQGDSTIGMSKYCDCIISVDNSPEYYWPVFSKLIKVGFEIYDIEKDELIWAYFRKDEKQICLIYGESPLVIKHIVYNYLSPIFFYLDAHCMVLGHEKFFSPPLREEILAMEGKPDSVIMIHDCQVPGQTLGYNYPISYEYIKDVLTKVNPNYKISYNSDREAEGEKRGILYAVPF